MLATYTDVDKMLHSGCIKHRKPRNDKSHCNPCHWAERHATAPENRVQTSVEYWDEYDNGQSIDVP